MPKDWPQFLHENFGNHAPRLRGRFVRNETRFDTPSYKNAFCRSRKKTRKGFFAVFRKRFSIGIYSPVCEATELVVHVSSGCK